MFRFSPGMLEKLGCFCYSLKDCAAFLWIGMIRRLDDEKYRPRLDDEKKKKVRWNPNLKTDVFINHP